MASWHRLLQDNKTLHGEYMLGRLYKAQKKFDQACKKEKNEAGIQGWENYKCCACDTDINYDVIAKY